MGMQAGCASLLQVQRKSPFKKECGKKHYAFAKGDGPSHCIS
jgi:hypothetical protein